MKKVVFLSFVVVMVLAVTACSFNFTTANLDSLQMASEIDSSNKPITVTSVFSTQPPIIYLTGTIKNAPEDTKITVEWYFNEEDPAFLIDSAELVIESANSDFVFNLSIPDNGWPTGSYEVKLYIDGDYESSVPFSVQ